MIVLSVRTDRPEAETGLFKDQEEIAYRSWQAHRQLAETINIKIRDMLDEHNLSLHDLGGVIVFRGPGSFTGLRIGISVANALAESLSIPIVGGGGDDWIDELLKTIASGENQHTVTPEYGADPRTTQQKK